MASQGQTEQYHPSSIRESFHQDEDFMGKLAGIAKATHPRTMMLRMLQRYLAAIALHWRGPPDVEESMGTIPLARYPRRSNIWPGLPRPPGSGRDGREC